MPENGISMTCPALSDCGDDSSCERNIFRDFIMPAVSGVGVFTAFVSEKTAFLVFFSLIPLFVSLLYSLRIYKIMIYGIAMYSLSLSWLCNSVSKLTDNRFLHIIIALILISFVALVLSVLLALPFCIFSLKSYSRTVSALIVPFAYIFGEWLQGIFGVLSFPWIRLGNIASPFTLFIQSASLFGTLFTSLLILFINMFASLFVFHIKTPEKSLYVFSAVMLTGANLLFGCYNLNNHSDFKGEPLKAMIVQGNYPKDTKYAVPPESILEKYLELTYSSDENGADLILFPETAIHSAIYKTEALRTRLFKLCADLGSILLFGSQYDADGKHYNACMSVLPENDVSAAYLKRKLVPCGEYNPFKPILSDVISADFSPGSDCGIIESEKGRIGCAICFESVFPQAVSDCVKNGAEVIAVLTNDSWLGSRLPLYQHHTHSVMRAVENGKFVLTSTNTGISSVIDSKGNIIVKSNINTENIISSYYYMNNDKTFYTKYGDIILIPYLIITIYNILSLIFGFIFKKT